VASAFRRKEEAGPALVIQRFQYLFWDGIHPTRAAHTIVAQAAASVLGL
jgi:phospholipase/lecithinase/hemolysin